MHLRNGARWPSTRTLHPREHVVAHRDNINPKLLEHLDRHAFSQVQLPQQQMLGTHIVVIQPP